MKFFLATYQQIIHESYYLPWFLSLYSVHNLFIRIVHNRFEIAGNDNCFNQVFHFGVQ